MRYQTNFPLDNETTRRINRLLNKYQRGPMGFGMVKTVWLNLDVSLEGVLEQFPIRQVPGPTGGYERVDLEVFLAKLESALYDERKVEWKKKRVERDVNRMRDALVSSRCPLSDMWYEDPHKVPVKPKLDLTGIRRILDWGPNTNDYKALEEAKLKAEMDELRKSGEKWLRSINERKEEILAAFIAKYGCGPDEVELVEQRGEKEWKWWVKKKRKSVRVYDKLGVIVAIAKRTNFTLIADFNKRVDIKGCCSLGVPRLYHDRKLDICLPEEINDEGSFGDIGKYIYYVPREVFKEFLEGGDNDPGVIMSRVLASEIYRMKP